MSRLHRQLSRLTRHREGAFVPFLVMGDPDFDTGLALAVQLAELGADALELGFPTAHAIADGPTVVRANLRALEAGVCGPRVLEFIRALRRRVDIPLCVLAYADALLEFGPEALARDLVAAGADALLVADLPFESSEEVWGLSARHGLAPIALVSNETPESELLALDLLASGYVYVVARPGPTGAGRGPAESLAPLLRRIRRYTALPLLAGFGISSPEHVRRVMGYGADGVIVGSALIDQLRLGDGERQLIARRAGPFCTSMKAATLPVTP